MINFVGRVNINTSTRKSIKQLISAARRNKSGYEVITGPCIPYYDFDNSYNSLDDQEKAEPTDRQNAINSVKEVFPTDTLYIFSANGYSTASDKYKNSYHILVRGCGYAESGAALPKVESADPAVYSTLGKRQLFRLPYFSKEGENRPLIMDGKSLDDITPEQYSKWCVTNIEGEALTYTTAVPLNNENIIIDCKYANKITEIYPDAVRSKQYYRTVDKGDGTLFINYKNIYLSECSICKRTHDDNQFYGYLSKDKKLFYKCRKSNTSVFVFNYGPDTPVKKTIEQPVNNRLDKYNPTKFESKYCADYKPLMKSFDHDGVVAIASGTGTGKTHACAMHLSSNNKSAGVISFRISLAEKYKKDFKGFECYRDAAKGDIITDRWICQLDSLHRIKTTPDVLALDEINQVRRHLNAETFMNNSHYLQNRTTLKRLIKNCKTVIVMDANLSPLELNWLRQIRPDGNIKLYLNTAVPNPKEITIVKNQYKVLDSVKSDLSNGRKVVIAHNGGKKHHEPLKRLILKSHPKKKILVINSDTKDDIEVIAALNNPNIEFGKYDCIIYSPSVQSGVSYDVKNVFYRVYGIFSNCTNSSGDACQMLDRIRHPISKNTTVSIQEYNTSIQRSMDVLKNHILATRGHLKADDNGLNGLYNAYDDVEFLQNEILDERCIADIETNMDRMSFKRNFIRNQRIYGNTIVIDNDIKKTTVEEAKMKLDKNIIMGEIKSEKSVELNNAVNLSITRVNELREQLQKQEKIMHDDLLALKKYNINHHYKMDEPVDDAKWYKKYDDSKLKSLYNNTSKYFHNTLDGALEELKTREIRHDQFMRAGKPDQPTTTDECVVDYFRCKPKYQKEKVLIGWVKDLGYDSLNSKIEIDEDRMKIKLAACIAKLSETDFDILEKQRRKLKVLQKLKIEDKGFMKAALQFINGSLKTYFGISIGKKDKNSQLYIMKNDNINNKTFVTQPDGNIPVLGKQIKRDDEDDDDNDDAVVENPETQLEALCTLVGYNEE